jgi:hypothetical protein
MARAQTAYSALQEEVKGSDNLDRRKLVADLLYRRAVLNIIAGNYPAAKARLADMRNNARLPNGFLDHVYLGRPVSVRVSQPGIRLLPERDERLVANRLVNPFQVAAVLEGIVAKLESDEATLSFSAFVEMLSQLDNYDYRIFVGSFRNAKDASSVLNDTQELLAKPEIREKILRVFQQQAAAFLPKEGCDAGTFTEAGEFPRLWPSVNLAKPVTEGGYYGVWLGGCLTANEARSIIGVLLQARAYPPSARPYLWRYKIY